MKNCAFCKAIIAETGSYIVYSDKEVAVLLDIYPRTKGHLILIPTEHCEMAYDMPEKVANRFYGVLHASCLALREYGAKGINVGANIGKVAGQEMPHFSYHIIPRYEKDDAIEIEPAFKDTPWKQKSITLSSEEMAQICNDVKKVLGKYV
ncbi:MAG: HIT family protein [Oscillospiraceae bacterium]|nr:HIT family protein [Oscillospiraceae bacterium]